MSEFDPQPTEEELTEIIDNIRPYFDDKPNISINISATKENVDVRGYTDAINAAPYLTLRLVEAVLDSRDDLPDPPEEQTVGSMLDLFEEGNNDDR